MKTSNRFALLATVLVAFGSLSTAALAASGAGTANATVLIPITITPGVQLNFGTFAPGAGGSVTIAATLGGARSGTGVILSQTSAGTSGLFTIGGSASSTFSIAQPAAFNVSNGSGGTMNVAITLPGTTGTLSGGATSVYVGGVITVGAAQAAGTYAGGYNLVVEYN